MISNKQSLNELIKLSTQFKCESLFDIGSRDGDDANYIASKLNIKEVFIFEPIPDSAHRIASKYPHFNVAQLAISDNDGESDFNAINHNNIEERGISSLRDRPDGVYVGRSDKINVKVNRFDTWYKINKRGTVDLVKLDVEGCTYEALKGFGEILKKVKIMHLETESFAYWEGQHLKTEVESLMAPHFKLVYELHVGGFQYDQVWVNKSL